MPNEFTRDQMIDFLLYQINIDLRTMVFPKHLDEKIRSVSVSFHFDGGRSANYRIDDVSKKVKEYIEPAAPLSGDKK